MRIYSEIDHSQQTGFQSACAEFAQKPLSLDERLDIGNPSRKILELSADSPLFGLKKGDKLLVDVSMPVKGNDLVVSSKEGEELSIYRIEIRNGQKLLWPNLGILKDDSGVTCFKIVSLIREFVPPVCED